MKDNVEKLSHQTKISCVILGNKTYLAPLDESGIEERIIWNTVISEWKNEEDKAYAAKTIDESYYRKRKLEEIKHNKRFISGIYTSLEIYTQNDIHIGFINCYRFPKDELNNNSMAIGIAIPDPQYRSKGYGTEALVLYAEYLFENSIDKLYLITSFKNMSIKRIGEKLGFKFKQTNIDNYLILEKDSPIKRKNTNGST